MISIITHLGEISSRKFFIISAMMSIWMPFQSLKDDEYALRQTPGTLMDDYRCPVSIFDFIGTSTFSDAQNLASLFGGSGDHEDMKLDP